MFDKTEIAGQVAEFLLQIKAIKLQPNNPFTWASGWKSPIYCDNRVTLSHPPNADRCCAEATQSKAAGDFGRGLTGAKPLPRDACPPVWFCIDSRQTPVEIKPKLAIATLESTEGAP